MSPVPSPCIDVCAIDPHTGWCVGCARTLDEISAWPTATDGQKRAILSRLAQRKEPPADQ